MRLDSKVAALPKLVVQNAIETALKEDLGGLGDRTSDLTIPFGTTITAHIVSREAGVFCGGDLIVESFAQVSEDLETRLLKMDGEVLAPKDVVATITGPARALFTGERVALNFAGHMSGIATTTADMVAAVQGTKARIAATRKTLPGLRPMQKYAVMCGGGSPHRYGLSDGILIKDNHIAAAGSIDSALSSVMAQRHHLESVVIEVDTLDQLEAALAFPIQGVLLDNMTLEQLRRAVAMIDGKCVAEASGGITPDTVRGVAETGVDVISCGWLTHSVKNLDLGLDQHA